MFELLDGIEENEDDKRCLALEAKRERYIALKQRPKVKIDQGDDPKLKFNAIFNLKFPSIDSFETAKAIYKSILPIRGRRASYDIRPIGDRRHTRFQIRKLSAQEYTVTLTYLNAARTVRKITTDILPRPAPSAYRLLSFHRDGTIAIHCPVGVRGAGSVWTGSARYYGPYRYQPTEQAWNFLSQVLPPGMYISTKGFRRYKQTVKTYLTIEHKDGVRHYLLPAAKYALKLKQDETGEWQVLNPVQEKKQSLPKTRQARIRKALRDFKKYASVYWDLVRMPPPKWLPVYPLFNSPVNLLERMEKDQWDVLTHVRHTVSGRYNVWEPQFPTLDSALPALKEVLREYYNKLPARGFVYKPVPIGEMGGLWKYHSFWADVPPVFAPPKPRRSYKRESTSDNTKSSSASACTPSIDLSA
jgi:hypothetical protein